MITLIRSSKDMSSFSSPSTQSDQPANNPPFWVTRAPWLAWGLFWLSAVIAGAALALQLSTLATVIPPSWGFRGFAIAFSIMFSLVGAVVAARSPRNLIGWLLCAEGVQTAIQSLVFEYAIFTLIARPGSLPGGELAGWVDSWFWVIGLGVLGSLVLLLFPNGRPPSRRWRPVVWLSLGGTTLGAGALALLPGTFSKFGAVNSPVQISALSDMPFLANLVLVPMLGAIIVSATSLAVRFLRADSEIERHQLKWVAYAGVILAIAVVINQAELAIRTGAEDGVTDVLVILGALSMPPAIGIAVLRYRLYDIDLIINRTLIYGPLTATLAGTYTASIIFFRLVFVDILGVSSDAAVASTTVMIAALFVPVRNRFHFGLGMFSLVTALGFSSNVAGASISYTQNIVDIDAAAATTAVSLKAWPRETALFAASPFQTVAAPRCATP